MTDLAKKRVNHEDLYRIPESMTEESHDLVSAPRAWICEILSPATAQVDRAEKMPIHARHAIFHAGLIDPMLKALEVFRFEPDKWAVPGAGTPSHLKCGQNLFPRWSLISVFHGLSDVRPVRPGAIHEPARFTLRRR